MGDTVGGWVRKLYDRLRRLNETKTRGFLLREGVKGHENWPSHYRTGSPHLCDAP